MSSREKYYLEHRALTDTECRVIIAAKLYQKQNRIGPPWSWLRAQTDLSHHEFHKLMWNLRNRRLIGFVHKKPGSTYAPRRGVEAVLRQREQTSVG